MKQNRPIKLEKEPLKDRHLQTCVWLAEMKSCEEVAELIKQTYGEEITRQAVWKFSRSPRWQRLISFMKRRVLEDISKIPISNKAIRLNYLQHVYKESMTESLKTINQWGEVYELKLGAAIEAVKAAREEMEKDGFDKDDPVIGEEIELTPGGNGHSKPDYRSRLSAFINTN
jgi:hypothetical protein